MDVLLEETQPERSSTGASPEVAERTELLHALSLTFRALMWQGNKQSTGFMERINLTLPQAAVLWTLSISDGRATMTDLAQLTHQSGATVTGIVDRLTDAALVERDRDRLDRRVVYVRLTDQGTAKIDDMKAERLKQIEKMTESLNEAELHQLNTILSKLILTVE